MDKNVETLDEMKFAPLSKEQEQSLRDFERQFNNQNNTAYYLMALERK